MELGGRAPPLVAVQYKQLEDGCIFLYTHRSRLNQPLVLSWFIINLYCVALLLEVPAAYSNYYL